MDSNSNPIQLGDAFLLETPPKGMHLYIAVVAIDENKYLFLNATKRHPNSDTSCILRHGASVPSFIIQESVIAYQFPREYSENEISRLIDSGVCQPKGNCSPNILYQIQMGGVNSERLKNKYKKIIKAHLGLT
jgi:hypothetical protein